jgi:hypothetical protein
MLASWRATFVLIVAFGGVYSQFLAQFELISGTGPADHE